MDNALRASNHKYLLTTQGVDMKLLDFSGLARLDEANVLNITNPFNNVSVLQFVTQLTSPIDNPQLKQQVIKRLSKLIVNDPILLTPILPSQLPPAAPDFAVTAANNNDLFVFGVSAQNKPWLQQISRYITKAAEDTKSPQRNTAVAAQRELDSLAKAETIDLIRKKSTEYFQSGENAASRDQEGLKFIHSVGQYTWYELITEAAFTREGSEKVLNNCIGKYHTLNSCQRNGYTIYVMRDKAQNSVVGLRITTSAKAMQEIKGKGNSPPVEQYMIPSVEFIKHMGFTISTGAQNDLQKAQYYVSGNDIIPLAAAVEEMLMVTNIATLANGFHVKRIKPPQPASSENQWLFDKMSEVLRSKYAPNMPSEAQLYILRTGSKIVGSASTVSNVLTDVWQIGSPHERGTGNIMLEFLAAVKSDGAFSAINPSLKKRLGLGSGLKADADNNISSYNYDEDVTINNRKVSVMSDTDAREFGRLLMSSTRAEEPYAYRNSVSETSAKGDIYTDAAIDKVYAIKGHTPSNRAGDLPIRGTIVLAKTEGGYLLPYMIAQGASSRSTRPHISEPGSELQKSQLKQIGEIATDQQLKLPLEFCAQAGIIKDGEGKYSPMTAPITQTAGFQKVDLSKSKEVEKFVAIYALLSAKSNSLSGDRTVTPSRNNSRFEMFGELDSANGGRLSHEHIAPGYRSDGALVKAWKEMVAEIGGHSPTAVYTRTVDTDKQESHATIYVVGNNVVCLDTFAGKITKGGAAPARSGGDMVKYGTVIDQINKLIEANGLSISQEVVQMGPEFSIEDNVVQSPMSRLERRRDTRPDATMTFADGTEIRKPTSEEFKQWLASNARIGADSDLLYISKRGKVIGSIVSNDTQVLNAGNLKKSDDTNTPSDMGKVVSKLSPYIKAFADANNLSISYESSKSSGWSSDNGVNARLSLLTAAHRLGREVPRERLFSTAGVNIRDAGGATSDKNIYDLPLVRAGLLTTSRPDPEDSVRLGITPKGVRAVTEYEAAGGDERKLNILDYTDPAPLKQAAVPRPTREPRVQQDPNLPQADRGERTRVPMEGGGNKATLAMARFREMTADNGGNIPARGAFIAILQQPPFNMTPAGASTYQYNIKTKYAREQGQIGESFTFKEFLLYIA